MIKKYEFTGETKSIGFGRTLKRIRAVISFGTVEAGEIGGWIEKEENLSHDGKAWICGDAEIWGNAKICGDAEIWGNAKICGDAEIWGNAEICGDAEIWGNAEICGDAEIFSSSHYLVVGPIGSRYDFTTFFRGKQKEINVKCGCFHGHIEEFVKKVEAIHGDSKHAKVYFAAVQLAKEFIDLSDNENV